MNPDDFQVLADDIATLKRYILVLENHINSSGGVLPVLEQDLDLRINEALNRDNPFDIDENVDSVSDSPSVRISDVSPISSTQDEGMLPHNRKKKLQIKRKKDNALFASYKLSGHKDGIWDLCVPNWTLNSDDSPLIVSASCDGTVGLWRMDDQVPFYRDLFETTLTKQKTKQSKSLDVPGLPSVPRSPRGKSPMIGRLTGHIGSVHSVKAHPTLPIIASCGGDGQLLSWKLPFSNKIRPSSQTRSFEPFRIFNIEKKPFKKFSSPWYRHLSSFSSFQESPYHFISLDYTPKGDKLLMSSISGLGLIYDIERPDPICRFSSTSSFSYISACSHSTFLTCSQSGKVNLWDLRDTSKPTLEISVSKGEVVTCARLISSPYLATTSHDRTLRIIDIKNPKDSLASILTTNSRVGSGIPMRFSEHPTNPFRILIPFDAKLGKIFNLSRAALESTHDSPDYAMHVTPLETLRPKMFTCAAWVPSPDSDNTHMALMGSFPADIYGWKTEF